MTNKKPILVLIVSAFAAFLATFNETFLNIALTPIMQDLNVSVSTVQWLTTAYMLGAAIMVPIAAFLYRKFRTKPLFLFTVGILIIGSLICATAQNFVILLLGRIIQSLGTGMLVPISMNMTLSVVPKEKIGTYMGIMGAATTLGPSLSIVGAGLLLNLASWHILFWTFGTLSLILFILGVIILGKDEKLGDPTLDALSVILISITLIGLLYGISTVFSGNKIVAIASILIGIICLVCFVKRQNKIEEPLINLKPLGIKRYRLGISLNMLAIMIVFSMNIIMPLYMQNAIGVSAFTASLTLFPAIILSCIVAPLAGRIYDKKGIRQIFPIGFTLAAVFILLLGLTRDVHILYVITLLYIPVIVGLSLIIGPAQSYALGHLPRELNTHGVTMISTGFQVAGCIGSSLFTGVYSLAMEIKLGQGASNEEGISFAYFVALLVGILVAIIGLIIAMKARKLESKQTETLEDQTGIIYKIMKKDVYTVKEDDTILSVMKLITEKMVSGVPVINNKGDLTGFISDGDVMRYLSKANPLYTSPYSFIATSGEGSGFDDKLQSLMKASAKDIARKKVITVNTNTELEEVCKILNEKHLKKVPVMQNGKMVGIINRSNITKYAIDSYLSLN